jgi:RHS repeat-associated protein
MKQALRFGLVVTFCLFLSAATNGQNVGASALKSGLITWLQLDDQSGSLALDASGSGRSATIVNGSLGQDPGRYANSFGIVLSGSKFIRIPLAWQPTRFTISWWVAPNSRGAWTQAVMANDWGSFLFHASPDGTIYVGTDLNSRIVTRPGVFELNSSPQQPNWQLFTFTFERNPVSRNANLGTGRLYKNGQQLEFRENMALPSAWNQLTFGYDNGTLAADGYYDDIRVYDRALSAAEVAQLAVNTETVHTPPVNGAADNNRNWSLSRSFDGKGNIIEESKGFADALGRPTQAQVKSQTTGHVLASQTVYNRGGKGALSTLPAPINNRDFRYESSFITSGGSPFGPEQIEGLYANGSRPVDQPTVPGSVGYYYSTNNTLEPLTPATTQPFSLVEEYAGPMGGTKRAVGPGDQFTMGSVRESKSREFPLLNEMDQYLSWRPQFVSGTPLTTSLWLKGEKAVSIGVDGKESISFTDADGRSLATCLSGSHYPGLTLTAQIHATQDNPQNIPVYQDLHIPAAGAAPLTISGTGALRIINLLTDAVVGSYTYPWPAISLDPGFYRVVSERDNQVVRYLARYGDFSYSYYDDASRVVATIAPKGTASMTAGTLATSTAGRVGHWSFNEASGNFAADQSDNGLTGTLVNQPIWSSNTTLTSPAGGSNLVFNGQGSYVRLGDIDELRMGATMSFEAWIYPTGNQSGILINKENEYEVARFPDGSIQWAFNNANPGWAWVNTGITTPLNTWSHIGITYNNGVVTAYLNGNQVGTPYQGAGAINYVGSEFWIGGRPATWQYFQGAIDEVRMWNTVRVPSPGAVGQLPFVTRNTYSGTGSLLATQNDDEGRSEFVYARDGRIRFSQSAEQKRQNRFSYSNYDQVGRVVESGEYATDASRGQNTVFENQASPTVTQPYEVEAQAQPAADINNYVPGYRGSGFADNLTTVGRGVRFSVSVPAAGVYPINIRYTAAGSATRTMSLYVDGVDVQQVLFPTTDSWSNWSTQSVAVNLSAGSHTLVVQYDADDNGWINVDYLDLIQERTPAANSVLSFLEDRTRSGGLDEAGRSQRNMVWYDVPEEDPTRRQWLGRTQEFVLGAVSKTSNGTSTTWYSYDDQGRVAWLTQDVPGVGKKTADYAYDFVDNVLEVAYQKGQPDAFYHHYEYDADQRLHSVYTSSDGLAQNRTLQARYFYYLHGPLKRVELADRLQGRDYVYTVQGWLKSINNSQKSLDQDSPKANGVPKDLFGMRLDYFDGDYRSRQLTAPNLSSAANQNDIRYDGSVRANTWHTAASPTVHGNAYRYDAKGRLLQSDYGQLTNGTTLSYDGTVRRYEEGNLSYDAHGNILTLRRTDGMGASVDNFRYDYVENTNKLRRTLNGNNAPVLSYEYDLDGQMTRESEAGKGDKYLRYDVTGKVTGVYRDAAFNTPVALYTYNDRGFRVSKTTYATTGTVQNTTTYVRDATGNVLSTYEQEAGKALQLTEVPLYGLGRVGTVTRVADGTAADAFDARYELNDQLGNARVVFHKPVTRNYLATMEPSQATQEEKDFENLPATRTTGPMWDGTHSALLRSSGALLEGPKKQLSVAKGDTVTFSAMALYFANGFGRSTSSKVTPYLVAGALTSTVPSAPLVDPDTKNTRQQSRLGQALGRLRLGIAIPLLAGRPIVPISIVPPVYLRYRLFEPNSTTPRQQGVINITGPAGNWEELKIGMRAEEAGTLELTTINSSFDNDAYFDHIKVEHTGGMIVQEQHQYAFGALLPGLSYTIGDKRYRHGYQGQFAEKDEETGFDSFELRMYNSRIGRWVATDPEGQFDSPYVGMSNNPVSDVDPDGGLAGGPGKGVGLLSKNSGYVGTRNLSAATGSSARAASSTTAAILRVAPRDVTARIPASRPPLRVSRPSYNPGTIRQSYPQGPQLTEWEQAVHNGRDIGDLLHLSYAAIKGGFTVYKITKGSTPILASIFAVAKRAPDMGAGKVSSFVVTEAGAQNMEVVKKLAEQIIDAGKWAGKGAWPHKALRAVVVDGKNILIDGHHRLAAAKMAKFDGEIPFEIVPVAESGYNLSELKSFVK